MKYSFGLHEHERHIEVACDSLKQLFLLLRVLSYDISKNREQQLYLLVLLLQCLLI
jgi:hypothetical protein